MRFLNEQVFWHLVWILPVLAAAVIFAINKRARIRKILFGIRADSPLFIQLSTEKRNIRLILLGLGVLLLITAVARPFWGHSLIPFSGQGRDLMIVFDVSKSMLAEDVKPSRLEHAKWFVRHLVEALPGDRFGLIPFAGESFMDCPLTNDKTSLFQILDDLNQDTIPIGGTNIQNALEKALTGFRAAETKHRAIVLITDGDELTGNCRQVIGALREAKIPVFVVGIGNPDKPEIIMQTEENGKKQYMRDSAGELVKTKLNEPQLRQLANETDGVYVRSTVTHPGLESIESRARDLVPKEFETGKRMTPIERFHIPLFLALLVLTVWALMTERKVNALSPGTNGLSVWLFAALFLGMSLSGMAQTSPVQDDQVAPPPPVPGAAPDLDEDILKNLPGIGRTNGTTDKKNPQGKPGKPEKKPTPEELYNAALKLQSGPRNDPKESGAIVQLYEQAISDAKDKPDVRQNSYQNLGVMLHADSRSVLNQAQETAKQNPDEALKKVELTKKGLDNAEEMYRHSLGLHAVAMAGKQSDAARKAKSLMENQQKLLNDRENAEKLKKMIEELKKKQEEAKKQTQQAQQQQNKENQKKDQKKEEQKDKKDQQQQQQQQQGQGQDKQQQKQDQQQQQKDKQQQQGQQDKQKQNQQQQGQGQDKQQQQQDQQQQQKDKQQQQDQKQQQDKQQQQQGQQDQQKQDQQKQEQQQQGQGQEQQQEEKSAKDLTDQAKKATEDLKDQAKKLENKNIEESAKQAEEEIDKARQAQDENRGKDAEDHLKKALEQLGVNPDEQKNEQDKANQEKNNSGQTKDQKEEEKEGNKDKQDQQQKDQGKDQKPKQDRQLPKEQKQAQMAKQAEEQKEIDPSQADALLEVMANDEKNLREALKEVMRRNSKLRKVEKDW